ncbi:uncharacterized protein L3040_003869 [Drepanopeziza brunnea f. sp. 'multigermtubi']|uniref:Uncharacterized protein n=1 Tax=Marssonina brunnea f. sp. multigermtubi (strain MB_m1) TaxID=1072389 RepID=K1X2A4_MARBU|nr:uncharacterized protein MBM_07129 [Drepanopeziza brunnea f. sp. 'multigermtubi' MB_m1]EKD14918.1 hypothetical protein MBM_07129 [Drepanopeziza brunnea f. sp. 'multigermtubi' MB_m1]KAJ5046631.1 hypothetical protein L3040_003869 [Drepanopeziza brunnea f. sp. 'multigermtubi']
MYHPQAGRSQFEMNARIVGLQNELQAEIDGYDSALLSPEDRRDSDDPKTTSTAVVTRAVLDPRAQEYHPLLASPNSTTGTSFSLPLSRVDRMITPVYGLTERSYGNQFTGFDPREVSSFQIGPFEISSRGIFWFAGRQIWKEEALSTEHVDFVNRAYAAMQKKMIGDYNGIETQLSLQVQQTAAKQLRLQSPQAYENKRQRNQLRLQSPQAYDYKGLRHQLPADKNNSGIRSMFVNLPSHTWKVVLKNIAEKRQLIVFNRWANKLPPASEWKFDTNIRSALRKDENWRELEHEMTGTPVEYMDVVGPWVDAQSHWVRASASDEVLRTGRWGWVR